MEQRDYLQKQIEQLGLFFEVLISQVYRMKETGNHDEFFTVVQNALKKETEFTVEEVLNLPHRDVEIFIARHLHGNLPLAERLAKLIAAIAEQTDDKTTHFNAKEIREKSLLLYQYIDRESNNFSFERAAAIEELKGLLKN